MREYGGDILFICLEAENLAKKRFSFKVFFIAPWSLFSNNSIHSRSGIFRCFRDPIRVPRIRENYHRVPRVKKIGSLESQKIGSLKVHTGCLTISLKKAVLDIYICDVMYSNG